MILTFVSSPLLSVLLRLCFLTGTDIRYLLEMTYSDLVSMKSGLLKIHLLYGCIPDIPVDEGIQSLLRPYIGEKPGREFLFTHDDGSTWTPLYVNNQIADISERSGFYFTADSLKKSYYNTEVHNIIPAKKSSARSKLYRQMISEYAS